MEERIRHLQKMHRKPRFVLLSKFQSTRLDYRFIEIVCHLEPFLEAIPQTHILMIMFLEIPGIFTGTSYQTTYLFFASFISSVFCATLGIAKFLKVGPCPLVPDEGFLGGHMNMGYILLFINIGSTILGKGFTLAAMGVAYDHGGPQPEHSVDF